MDDVFDYEKVLDYWFSGDINLNYKTKWFPTDSLQSEIDHEIHTLFADYLENAIESKLSNWIQINPRSHLALIIVLDQFSRHIYRHLKLPQSSPIRIKADELALETAEILINNPSKFAQLSSTDVIFALMPYRHNATIPRLRYIMSTIDAKEKHELTSLTLLNKFRKQTLTRLQRMEDKAKVCFMCILIIFCLYMPHLPTLISVNTHS